MNTADTALTSHVSQLLRDPLHCVREAHKQGKRVIGYVGNDAPVELILAADAVPIRLRGIADAPTPLADQYLESAFVPEIRAITELWLSGQLQDIDSVVFPRSNDSAQRLYYYLCELRRTGRTRGPTPLLFDTATLPRPTSLEHTKQSLHALAAALRSNLKALPEALQRTHHRAQLIGKSTGFGANSLRISRAAELDWRTSFDTELESWLRTAQTRSNAKRLLFAGNAPPDERFHIAAESVGASIAFECTESQIRSDGDLTADPLTTLALRHHSAATPARLMFLAPDYVLGLARRVAADGVILWAIEEDETLPWEVAQQAKLLRDAHIPVLLLTRQRWLADENTLKQVRDFAFSLERVA